MFTKINIRNLQGWLTLSSPVAGLIKAAAFGVVMAVSSANVLAGFSISGTQLLDGNGQPFVMRGINHPHNWYPGETSSFANIAATGANTVRVVLSDGQQWTRNSASDVANVISLCKANQLICVLEVHDVTGSGESSAAGTMANAAQYWVSIASALQGQEDYVIINIANEPFGNNQPASSWTNQHIAAIQTIRNAGLTHTLMVDAANWGQDWEQIMLANASTVANADNLDNTMFSVHMYEVYSSASTVQSYVSTFLNNHNLPLVVGEFGADHQGAAVDEDAILSVAEQYNIGYLGWSWSGNGSCCTSLDIVNSFNPNSLSTWGNRLINGANGIAATSVRASVYGGGGNPTPTPTSTPTATPTPTSTPTSTPTPTPGGGQQCNWYGSLYPLCVNQSSGWGWENQQSCIGADTCSSQSGGGGIVGGGTTTPTPAPTATPTPTPVPTATPTPVPTATPTPGGSGQQCNWYGVVYPLCQSQTSGWGWENQQSCIGATTCEDQWGDGGII